MGDIQSEFVLFGATDRVMNGVRALSISDTEVNKLLSIEEGHFADLKAIETLPAGLRRAIAALSNAEGGELFLGIDENRTTKKRRWRGFANQEAANSLQTEVWPTKITFPIGSTSQSHSVITQR